MGLVESDELALKMTEKEKEAEKKAFLFFFLTYSLLTKHDPFVNFVK